MARGAKLFCQAPKTGIRESLGRVDKLRHMTPDSREICIFGLFVRLHLVAEGTGMGRQEVRKSLREHQPAAGRQIGAANSTKAEIRGWALCRIWFG